MIVSLPVAIGRYLYLVGSLSGSFYSSYSMIDGTNMVN